jgi:hypothetical protein
LVAIHLGPFRIRIPCGLSPQIASNSTRARLLSPAYRFERQAVLSVIILRRKRSLNRFLAPSDVHQQIFRQKLKERKAFQIH